jgi:hypothetical protein
MFADTRDASLAENISDISERWILLIASMIE